MASNIDIFIDKLLSATKLKDILWTRLSKITNKNNLLIEFLEKNFLTIDDKNSFICSYSNGFFYLLDVFPDTKLLCIQPSNDSELDCLHTELEFQAELLRLYNIVIRQHPSSDKLIETFLKDDFLPF